MHLRPLQDWAVIRKSESREKTAGGIIIPEVAKEKPLEGVIVAIGAGKLVPEKGKEKEKKKKFVPTVLKPGQHIIYQKYAEREIELGGETITLVREEDILGTIEEGSVVEKKSHPVEARKDGPVAVRTESRVPAVMAPPAAGKSTPATKKKPAVKKPGAKKATKKEKPAAKKEAPSSKERSAQRSASLKAAEPGAKKTAAEAPSKKNRSTPKKASAKKAAPKKKTAGKNTMRPAAKKPTGKPTTKTGAGTKRNRKR